jgi:predicted kinase
LRGQDGRVLVVVGGLPASGKSTLSGALARRIGAAHVRVDTIEQAVVRSGVAAHPIGPVGYTVAYAVAGDLLAAGLSVVADSVNPLPVTREAWRAVARKVGVEAVEVEVVCSDPAEHHCRATGRTSDIPGLVPPSWQEIIERDYQPWDHPHAVIDTAGRCVEDCLHRLLAALPRPTFPT